MKEGWEYKKLEDCFISINNGANIRQVKGAKGIPVTRIETLSNDIFNRERMGYADILDASPYSSYILNDGDILMSHINSMKFLGRAVQYSKKGNETIIHGMNLLRLVPTKDVLSSFLVYQFYTAFFRNQIVSISHQSVNQASFNTTNLKNLKLKVPTLSEQQSIVNFLDSAFAKIDAMKANAEKALNEAKALFQASLKDMLEPKEGWEESELKDIVDEKCPISYGIVQQGDHVEGGIPVVRPVDLNRKYITTNGLKCTTESISSSYKRTILRGDEILLGVRGTTGIIGIATEELNGCNVNRGVVPLFFKDTICRDFIFYEMLSPAIQAVFAEKTTGATLKQINIKDLRTIVFSYPIIEIQQSIVATLDSLKSKVDRLQENYDKISQECDALKQAILRQVFE